MDCICCKPLPPHRLANRPYRIKCRILILNWYNLDLYFLPSHSPELYAKRYPLGQPAERLWPLTNEVIANDSPHSLKELEELLIVRCRKLLQQQDLISGLTCYHWWPTTRAI